MDLFPSFLILFISLDLAICDDDADDDDVEFMSNEGAPILYAKPRDEAADDSLPFDNVKYYQNDQSPGPDAINDASDVADITPESPDDKEASHDLPAPAGDDQETHDLPTDGDGGAGHDDDQYEIDIKKGLMSDLFSSNMHISHPSLYTDFGRRHQNENVQQNIDNDPKLEPVKASPDVVMAAAAASLRDLAEHPVDPDEFRKLALRSGDHWDSYWKRDVNPQTLIRGDVQNIDKPPAHSKSLALKSVTAKIKKGTKLANLVSVLKPYSSVLLYIINKDKE